jgi:hypothetical protein
MGSNYIVTKNKEGISFCWDSKIEIFSMEDKIEKFNVENNRYTWSRWKWAIKKNIRDEEIYLTIKIK